MRVAFLLAGDRGHAEDLVQQALYRTFTHWDGLHDTEAAFAYTRVTLTRLAGRWRQRRWHGEVPGDPPDTAGPDVAPDRARALDLHAALGKLPWSQRAVLVLRYYADLSEAETAAVLRCSPGTVKSRAHRALAALRIDEDVPHA